MERKSPGPGTGTSMAATDQAQAPKRYRPAPAKTFQCRGYGDCRMVFSRSEHLARHIRKHTGERPFACHCSKQFSRLDNLRQHAQTVHADKHDQNERMMRDLTSLHATMAAANKLSARTHRRPAPAPSPPAPAPDDAAPAPVKQEDPAPVPYELYPAWQNDMDNPKYFFSAPGSRPATSERLPPLSSIVQQQPAFPRTATAPRPPSSSAAFYPAKPFYPYPRYEQPPSEQSPFYFAPPESRNSSSNSPPSNPRKRAFSGPDGPVHSYDELAAYSTPQQPPNHPAQLDYDYGSESRPQSRRLSVMELCNDAPQFVDDAFIVNGDRSGNHTPLALGAMSISGPQRRTTPSSASGRSDEGHARSRGSINEIHSNDARLNNGVHGRITDAHGRITDDHSRINDAHGRISPPSRRLTPHGIVNGNSYPPPPRPHSTTFSVSSTTSNSPPVPPGYSASQPQTHFAYPPPPPPPQSQPQHPHHHPNPHPHPHAPYALVGAMPSLHHQQYTPSPAPTSATSYYSSRSSSFSPRSPGHVGAHAHGHGHLAHQQAQAYHALQAQQGAAAAAYSHHHQPHHTGYPSTYEYGQGYNT